jgi:predicted acylesterase/phospholipase RssA
VVGNDNEIHRLRTYQPRSHVPASPLCTIWQACRATSAAPLYFPVMEIDNQEYFDGGLKSNNPILEAVEEAILELHNPSHSGASSSASFRVIVSLGTGKPEKTEPSENAIGITKYALKQLTDTQAKHDEFLRRFPDIPVYSDLKSDDPNACYFRLNEETTLYKIDLADWKSLGKIKSLAEAYVASEGGVAAIKACAAKVARKTVLSA